MLRATVAVAESHSTRALHVPTVTNIEYRHTELVFRGTKSVSCEIGGIVIAGLAEMLTCFVHSAARQLALRRYQLGLLGPSRGSNRVLAEEVRFSQ